jgi:hypothetical protein
LLIVWPGGLVALRPGATALAEVLGVWPFVLRWPGAMLDAPGLVLPVVDVPFVPECMVPFVPVDAPPDPVAEFVMPVLEPAVVWADAADATATTNPAATKPIPMRFMV